MELTTKELTTLLMEDPTEFQRVTGTATPPAPHASCLTREVLGQLGQAVGHATREKVFKPLTAEIAELRRELKTERDRNRALEERLALLESRTATLDTATSAHRRHLSNIEQKISTLIHGK